GLCGEGADSLFGLGMANELHNAGMIRALMPARPARRFAEAGSRLLGLSKLATVLASAEYADDFADLRHPVNQVAVFTDWHAVNACFGKGAVADAAARRRGLTELLAAGDSAQNRLHAAGFLGEALESASLWATMFNHAGAELLCPFLDSRILRLALNLPPSVRYRYRRPKDLLKRALERSVPPSLVYREKLGFGQPIFEWMAANGQLRPLLDRLGVHDFVDRPTLEQAFAKPNWFLYSLLCWDVWHRLFIDKTWPRPDAVPFGHAAGAYMA
ncbi:MAG: asparagine synthase-related protein, partial [Candidatus Acidiferrum sp.]